MQPMDCARGKKPALLLVLRIGGTDNMGNRWRHGNRQANDRG